VGIPDAKGASVEDKNIEFATDVIYPTCIRWQQELDIKLLSDEERDQGLCIRFDLDELNAANLKAKYDSMAIGRQWGFLNADDCRKKINMPPLPKGEGQTFLQPLNMAGTAYAKDILLQNKNATPNEGEGSQKKL
jgi:phage portal protein BeeE